MYEVKYGVEHKDAVIELIEGGMTLTQISAIDGMPDASIVYNWRKLDKKFQVRYDTAVATRTLHFFDLIQSVAVDLLNVDKNLSNAYTTRVKVATDMLLKTAALVAPSVATPKGVMELITPDDKSLNLQVTFVDVESDPAS